MNGFEKVLARYGSPVIILPEGAAYGVTVMALLQPVRDKERQSRPSPLGWGRRERWLYLGEPDVPLEGKVRTADGQEFEVYSARKVDLGRQTCHWWGILLPVEEKV